MRALEKAARRIPDFRGDTETLNAEKIVEKAKIYIKGKQPQGDFPGGGGGAVFHPSGLSVAHF